MVVIVQGIVMLPLLIIKVPIDGVGRDIAEARVFDVSDTAPTISLVAFNALTVNV